MKNNNFNSLDVKKRCETKLEIKFDGSKECNGWFRFEGKKVKRITIPKGRKFIPKETYKSMAKQLAMTVEQLDGLLECPITMEDYLIILKDQNLLPEQHENSNK